MPKEIKTPFGRISPEVSLFPIYYLVFIYGFVYIFPYGKNLIGISWFDWLRSEDGPLEWLQFFEYFLSSNFSSAWKYCSEIASIFFLFQMT